MILAACSITRTEAEIYECCQTDIDGTLPSALVECATSFGFTASAKRLEDRSILQTHVGESFIILFVNLAPLLGIHVIHAVILETIVDTTQEIQIIDPAFPPNGKRVWSLGLFERGWNLAHNQTILIAPAT